MHYFHPDNSLKNIIFLVKVVNKPLLLNAKYCVQIQYCDLNI